MCRSTPLLVIALAFLLVPFTSAADPFHGYYGSGFPWFGYGKNGPAAYALGNVPSPPYFALHPPVYYSHPIARSYGHSPFACACECRAESPREPRVVMNPHLPSRPSEPAAAVTTDRTAFVPLRISNPYYQPQPSEAVLASQP